MKRAFPALTIALPHLMAAATAEPKYVEFNYDLARSYAGDGVSFLASDQNPLPGHLLMGLEARKNSPPGSPKNSPPGSPKNSPPGSPKNGVTPADFVPCSVTTEKEVSGTVTVLIAISKCLSNSAVETIKTWAKNLQKDQMTFFQDGTASKIVFEVASVPGTCQAISQANEHGQALLADDAVDERLASFSEIGRVLDAMPSSNPTTADVTPTGTTDTVVKNRVPVAVVSFVDSDTSFKTVEQYELTEKISRTFNFKICENGANCGGSFENCITLNEPVDLFMYSPFKITSTFNCANLKDGAPVVYLNSKNERQCSCTCPVGTKLSSDKKKCETVTEDNCQCVWANAPGGGYKKSVTTAVTKCEFSAISTNWGIPAPVAVDNYVAKGRTNAYDASVTSTHSGPHIDLITRRIGDPVYNIDKSTLTSFPNVLTNDMKSKMTLVTATSSHPTSKTAYTWSAYQSDRSGKVDKFTYTSYGKYLLDVDAYDYNATSAECKGCIAIVDKFRPEATTTCPKIQCDKSTSDCDKDEGILELTSANLKSVETQIKAYYDFQDLAKNDACDASTTPKRCDDDKVEKMNFDDDKYCDTGVNYRQDGADFYNANKIKADLSNKVGKLSNSDLCKEEPVAYGQCSRCIHLSTSLREYWTDYTCGRNYDTEKCEGKSGQTCDLKQCLAVFGDTIAVASAEIKPEIKKESKDVVAELLQEGYNTDTQVHVALQCTEFVDNAVTKPNEICKYTAKVQDLVSIDTKANTNSIFSNDEAKNLVTWRYRIDNGDWKSWDTRADFDYKKAETKISIEAWTKCGIVRKFFFYVNLHLNNQIKVCDNFRDMWYQSTNKKLTAPDNFCMYPKSDFAEITFDYHANIGLQYSPDKLNMNISRVECRLTYDDCKGNAKIVDVSGTAREIVSRFAVLAQRKPTSPLTKFHVTCDFTYKRYGSQSALTQTCNQDFFITDCTGPEIDKPCPLNDKSCPADKCIDSPLPAPYEACGGNIVSIDADNNAVFTSASAADSKCCEFCEDNYKTTCSALPGLPSGVNDIRRCEPVPKTPVVPPKPYLALAATEALSSATQTTAGTATLLLSASAMVALVALVAVQRRRAAPAAAVNKDVMEDAYYPLLN